MKDILVAIRMNLCFVVVTGLLFPLTIWAIAQVLFPYQANGSFVRNAEGTIIGSALIGQRFASAKYFHGRPSAAGSGYDASNSGGTNLGPTSAKLFNGIKDDPSTDTDETYKGVSDLAIDYRRENHLSDGAAVPVDAVTRSASGLDPHISPANALLQAKRISKERGIELAVLEKLVASVTEGRFLGIYGEPHVNVLALNQELDKADKRK